jgi:hypothetical protein
LGDTHGFLHLSRLSNGTGRSPDGLTVMEPCGWGEDRAFLPECCRIHGANRAPAIGGHVMIFGNP